MGIRVYYICNSQQSKLSTVERFQSPWSFFHSFIGRPGKLLQEPGPGTGNRMVHGAKLQIQQRDGNTVIFKSVVNIKHANFHECFGFFMQKTVCFLFKTQWSKGKQQQLYFFIATKYLGVLLWNCFEFRLFFKFGYF